MAALSADVTLDYKRLRTILNANTRYRWTGCEWKVRDVFATESEFWPERATDKGEIVRRPSYHSVSAVPPHAVSRFSEGPRKNITQDVVPPAHRTELRTGVGLLFFFFFFFSPPFLSCSQRYSINSFFSQKYILG